VNAGGLVGSNTGYLQTSYATGAVSGNNNTGGLVGSNHGNISNTYSTGSVAGNAGMAGGVAGFNAGTISASYSTGAVTGEQGYTGGFVGDDPLEQVTFGYWDTDTSGISDPEQGAGFPTDDPGITGLTTAQLQSKLPYGLRAILAPRSQRERRPSLSALQPASAGRPQAPPQQDARSAPPLRFVGASGQQNQRPR